MVEVYHKDILSLVPFKVLDKISGTPTFTKMIKLRKQLGANLIVVEFPWRRGKGQLILLQDPATFAARTGRTYNPPTQQPPTYPNIPMGTSTTDQERMCAKTIKDEQNWQNYKHCKHICVKQMIEAI